MRVDVTHGMHQGAHLSGADFNDLFGGVTACCHAEGGGQVQISFSFRVPYMHAFGFLPNHGPSSVLQHEGDVAAFMILQFLKDLVGLRLVWGWHGSDQTPLASGGQMILWSCAWKRAGSASCII